MLQLVSCEPQGGEDMAHSRHLRRRSWWKYKVHGESRQSPHEWKGIRTFTGVTKESCIWIHSCKIGGRGGGLSSGPALAYPGQETQRKDKDTETYANIHLGAVAATASALLFQSREWLHLESVATCDVETKDTYISFHCVIRMVNSLVLAVS